MKPQFRLIVTERCNLDCEYCHKATLPAPESAADPRRAVALLAQFAGLARSRGWESAELSLYGGEPLLDGSLIEAALREAARLREQGFDYEVMLNTNATRITPETARRLAEANVDVHASLDGVDREANGLRLNFAGRSSAEWAKRGIRLAREAGCRLQLNTVVTRRNLTGLPDVLDYAVSAGADRMFVALADDRTDLENADELAGRLLALDGRAQGRLRMLGPWRAGLWGERPALEWPPLSVNALASGEVFFSHFPDEPQPSLEQAYSQERCEDFGSRWAEVVRSCAGCPILSSCRGYLKMMIRYHHGDDRQQQMECGLARRVAEMAERPEFEMVRTTADLRVRRAGEGRVEIENPLLPNSRLTVSEDLLEVLGRMSRGGNLAALRQEFEADNLDETFAALRSRRLLVKAAEDTDQLLLGELSGAERYLSGQGLRLGAAGAAALERWDPIVPYLQRAYSRLPERLSRHTAPLCLFGAANRADMAAALGRREDSPELEWMAATVSCSILVFNLEACARVVDDGGRKVRDAFVQQCAHELAHLALRQAGVRLPVWLEEGFCEYLSGAPLSSSSLRYAAQWAPRFREFALRVQAGELDQDANLLALSASPVGENPAYHLAHDFVRFVAEQAGLDRWLDLLREAGVRALPGPFPLADAEAELLRLPLSAALGAWMAGLRERTGAADPPMSPLRVVRRNGRAAIYNRMMGGLAAAPSAALDPERLRSVDGRDLTLEEGVLFWGQELTAHPQFPRWASGVPSGRTLHLRLMAQNACNMRCTYCYKEDFLSQGMSPETADRAIRVWQDLLEPGERERATVRLFGGEPLLNWNLVSHVVRAMEPWRDVPLILNTNGTLLKPEHVAEFRRLGSRMRVAISCDGVGAVNDLVRLDAAGRGTFHRVDAAARLLCEAKLPLALNAVVGRDNYRGLPEMARYVLSLRREYDAPVSLSLELVIPPPPEPGVRQGLLAACVETVGFCLEQGVPVVGTMAHPFDALIDPNGANGYFCAATGSELIVGPTGDIMHCPAVRLPSYANLDTVERDSALPDPVGWGKRRGGNLPGCRGCEVEGLCGGGCAAQSQTSYGDVFTTPEPLFCEVTRAVFRKQLEHAIAACGSRV